MLTGLAVVLSLAGCGKEHPGSAAKVLPTAQVRTQQAEAKKHMATEEVVGTVRAALRASLEAKVSGRIEKMPVAAGQAVKAGDLLVQLDVREIQAKLEQSKALQQQVTGDRARYEELLKQNAVTRQEYDAVQARFRVAEAAVVEAQTMLDYASVTAPFAGLITRKFVDLGDLAAPGKALLELESQDKLRFEADVPEALIGRIKLGDKFPVRMSDGPQSVVGTVAEIFPTADAVSRTFRVKLDLPASPNLRGGQFGRTAVPLTEITSVFVPASALVQRGQMEIVFVAENGRAQLRLVKSGKRVGDEVEILSGLSANEQVVVSGAGSLLDGQPIEIQQ